MTDNYSRYSCLYSKEGYCIFFSKFLGGGYMMLQNISRDFYLCFITFLLNSFWNNCFLDVSIVNSSKLKHNKTNLCISILVEENVFQLQISVTNVVLVAVVDCGRDLPEDPLGLELLQTLLLAQVVVQLAAGRDLHHQDHLLLVFENWKE